MFFQEPLFQFLKTHFSTHKNHKHKLPIYRIHSTIKLRRRLKTCMCASRTQPCSSRSRQKQGLKKTSTLRTKLLINKRWVETHLSCLQSKSFIIVKYKEMVLIDVNSYRYFHPSYSTLIYYYSTLSFPSNVFNVRLLRHESYTTIIYT